MMYLLVILSVFIASLAQMLLKKGAVVFHSSLLGEYCNGWVFGGYALLGVSLLVNIYALGHGVMVKELSIIESLSYLFVPILSFFCFQENLSFRKLFSIIIILGGIVVFFY
jgi:drug/metabolite transporter (DMT)-like permease